MTKLEVKNKLSEYYKLALQIESLQKRIGKLKALQPISNEISNKLEELNRELVELSLKGDKALANVFNLIFRLDNSDNDIDVLRKYHVDGLSDNTIAKQLNIAVSTVRSKRWRAYEKLIKKL